MRAARYHGRADVRIEEVPEPRSPGPGEVLLEVTASSICGTDSSEWAHGPHFAPTERANPVTGYLGPITLGHEFVGRVAAVGDGVDAKAGDRLACGAGVSCGSCEWCLAGRTNLCSRYYTLGLHADGGLAELALTPAAICRPIPDSLDDVAASLAQPFAVALHAVRRVGVAAGEAVAVIGAGGIGSFVVAAAASRAPAALVVVDVDEKRLDTARQLGATRLIDAREEDAVTGIRDATGGDGAHVVIEASGSPGGPAAALAAARRGGRVLLVGLQPAPRELDLHAFTVREIDVVTTLAHVCSSDLPEAIDLLAASNLSNVVLDRTIPLDELVDEGLRPLAEHRAHGKLVVDPKL